VGQRGWTDREPPVRLVVARNDKDAIACPRLTGDLGERRQGVGGHAPVEVTFRRVASRAVDEAEVCFARRGDLLCVLEASALLKRRDVEGLVQEADVARIDIAFQGLSVV